jgi:hypothetical protein
LKTDYLLAASEAGAAASEATAEAASTAAEAAAGAASTAGASFLPQATRAAAANKDANRIDLFMLIFLKGGMKTISGNCYGLHHNRADGLEPANSAHDYRVIPMNDQNLCQLRVN